MRWRHGSPFLKGAFEECRCSPWVSRYPLNSLIVAGILVGSGILVILYIGELVVLGWVADLLSEIGRGCRASAGNAAAGYGAEVHGVEGKIAGYLTREGANFTRLLVWSNSLVDHCHFIED